MATVLQRAHVVPADADLRPNEGRLLLLLLMICHQKDSQRAFSLAPSSQTGKLRLEEIRQGHPESHSDWILCDWLPELCSAQPARLYTVAPARTPQGTAVGQDWDELGVLQERRRWLSRRAGGSLLSHLPPLGQDGEGLTGPRLQRSLQMLLSIQGPRLHHPSRRRPRYLPAHLRVSQWLVCVVRGYGGHCRASSEAGKVCGWDGDWVERCEPRHV